MLNRFQLLIGVCMSVSSADNTSTEVVKPIDETVNRDEPQQQDDKVTLLPNGNAHKVIALSNDSRLETAIQALHKSVVPVKTEAVKEVREVVEVRPPKFLKLAPKTTSSTTVDNRQRTTKTHKPLPLKFTTALVPATSEEKPMTNEFKFGQAFPPQAQAFTENLVTTQLGREHFDSSVHLFNANHIVLSSGEKVIAMAYPMLLEDEGRFHFWNMLKEHHVSNIIDLTEREYQENVRYYKDGSIMSEHGTLTVKASSQGSEYQRISVSSDKDSETTSVEVTRRHYTEWPDNGGLELPTFLALVDYLSEQISKGVVIHCVEGMGRTMTLLAGAEIRWQIKNGKITRDNYEVKVAEAINSLAKQRGNCVIKSGAQKHLLLDATKVWLGILDESQSSTN